MIRPPGFLFRSCALLVAILMTGSALGDEAQDSARRHFKLGIALFQNGDFSGALAEFEASHRDRSGASTQQNIALCLTRLHRYLAALETLEALKSDHSGSMSPQDLAAVDASIRELSSLVGTVTLHVKPANAVVMINGRPISSDALSKPIRVSSGEYTIVVEAPNHARQERVEKIAGGDDLRMAIELKPDQGEIQIQANDRQAAVAVDSQARAFGSWSGRVPPGTHVIQVYKSGHEPFVAQVPIAAGDRLEMHASLGDPIPTSPTSDASASPARLIAKAGNKTPPPRGWYGFFSASSLAPTYHPDGFGSNDVALGGSYGLRGGYRIWDSAAIELMAEGGGQNAGPADYTTLAGSESTRTKYELSSTRVGVNTRFFTRGRVVRLSAVLGFGSVTHRLRINDQAGSDSSNAYLLGELGAQASIGHVLCELMAIASADGISAVKTSEGYSAYGNHTLLPQIGIGVRVGYGAWRAQ